MTDFVYNIVCGYLAHYVLFRFLVAQKHVLTVRVHVYYVIRNSYLVVWTEGGSA